MGLFCYFPVFPDPRVRRSLDCIESSPWITKSGRESRHRREWGMRFGRPLVLQFWNACSIGLYRGVEVCLRIQGPVKSLAFALVSPFFHPSIWYFDRYWLERIVPRLTQRSSSCRNNSQVRVLMTAMLHGWFYERPEFWFDWRSKRVFIPPASRTFRNKA